MKVVIAMDSFKGSISSIDGSKAIASGIKEIYSEADIIRLPLADGGEGIVDILVEETGGYFNKLKVTGPLGKKVDAVYGILGNGKTAVIEIASACGLPLVAQSKRNPLVTTTYGVGELIENALNKGCTDFIIGLGGSATNDAGIGMLQALGYRFLDQNSQDVEFGGSALKIISQIVTENIHPKLRFSSFKVACDVDNPLYGPNGAAHIFGPQKGASKESVKELDDGLKHFSIIVREQMGIDIQDQKGAGAAGGLGGAFSGFLNSNLESGIEVVLDAVQFEKHLAGADFVITGEGKLDGQTSMGKAPLGVAKIARKYNVPVIALAGGVTKEAFKLNEAGISAYFSIMNAPMTLKEAMDYETVYENLHLTSKQLFRLIKVVKGEKESFVESIEF